MKKPYRISIVFFSLLLFTSCIRVETIIKVNKDGTGTITETVMMSRVFADMMQSFSESFGAIGEDISGEGVTEEIKTFSLFDEDKLNKEAMDFGEDVTYQSGKEVSEKDWVGYTAIYAFSDITKIKLNTSQEDKVDTGMSGTHAFDESEVEEKENEFYFFTFEKGSTSKLIINRYEIEDDSEDKTDESDVSTGDAGSMDMMNSEMMNMFSGMRFNMIIEVGGKVTNSNATYREGSSVTLIDMDFGKMMKNKDAFSELTRKKPETTAEMKSFIEKFDGLKLELEQPVAVSFR